MRKQSTLIATLALLLLALSSNAQDGSLAIFDPLVNTSWVAEGKWGNGAIFKQEIQFRYNLNRQIVIARSDGFTNAAQTTFGKRNFGIRQYDSISGKIKFWEFDVFGKLTSGEVIPQGKNILYQYNYGGTIVTDMWEYVNDATYNFIVGTYENGQWDQRFLEAQFSAITAKISIKDYADKLSGKWSSKAWDGQLYEVWSIDENGQLVQHAEYIEDSKVLYKASSRIERVQEDLIIFSVIEGNNPKIFKAINTSETSIIFENSDYGYPNKLVYVFNADGTYQRTISGIEKGEEKSYTFEFKRLE